jgi:hypothetical protein
MRDKDGFTALMFAAAYGHEGVCDLLITRGCKLDMQDKDGFTALMWAAEDGHIPIMISLIEAGCNHSLKNKEGKSGMDLLRQKHPDKVKEVQVIHLLTPLLTPLLTHLPYYYLHHYLCTDCCFIYYTCRPLLTHEREDRWPWPSRNPISMLLSSFSLPLASLTLMLAGMPNPWYSTTKSTRC